MDIGKVIEIAKTLTKSYINVSERMTYFHPSSSTERVCEIDWQGVHAEGNSWEEALRKARLERVRRK